MRSGLQSVQATRAAEALMSRDKIEYVDAYRPRLAHEWFQGVDPDILWAAATPVPKTLPQRKTLYPLNRPQEEYLDVWWENRYKQPPNPRDYGTGMYVPARVGYYRVRAIRHLLDHVTKGGSSQLSEIVLESRESRFSRKPWLAVAAVLLDRSDITLQRFSVYEEGNWVQPPPVDYSEETSADYYRFCIPEVIVEGVGG